MLKDRQNSRNSKCRHFVNPDPIQTKLGQLMEGSDVLTCVKFDQNRNRFHRVIAVYRFLRIRADRPLINDVIAKNLYIRKRIGHDPSDSELNEDSKNVNH